MQAFATSGAQVLWSGRSVVLANRRHGGVRRLRGRVQMQYAAGVAALEQEGAYAVLAAANALEAASGQHVVHLEIGQPGFATPEHVCEAGMTAIRDGRTKYSSPAGIAELREAIAKRTRETRGVEVDGSSVVVGPGAKPGLFFATLALVRGKQDEVVIPDPGFPTYAAMVGVANGTVKAVRLRDDLASFDMDAFRQSVGPATRLVVLNSPSNPTGGVSAARHARVMRYV